MPRGAASLAGDHAGRGRQDRGAEAAEHARQPVVAGVHAPAGLGDPLEAVDHALAAVGVLEVTLRTVYGSPSSTRKSLMKPSSFEQAGDLTLAWRPECDRLVARRVRVADAREHVGDRIGLIIVASYQLDFVMPGISPWCASSRRQMRHSPNFRIDRARAPARWQRV